MPIYCPPPRNLKPAGLVVEARCSSAQPPFIREQRYTGRRAQGKLYERRVHEHFAERFPNYYVSEQWFEFWSAESRSRWCQPDGLLIDPVLGGICVVEIKYQHTSDAWWQLRELYLPVVKAAFGQHWRFTCCEVVKWYDPAIAFPERVSLVANPLMVGPHEFGVHIWKPKQKA